MIKITTYGGIPNAERGTGGRWMGGGGGGGGGDWGIIPYNFVLNDIQFLYYYN